MNRFAKLFECPDKGQIVVMLREADDEGLDGAPEIVFFAQPQGLGVCSVRLGFDADRWDAAKAFFSNIEKADALEATANLFEFSATFSCSDNHEVGE